VHSRPRADANHSAIRSQHVKAAQHLNSSSCAVPCAPPTGLAGSRRPLQAGLRACPGAVERHLPCRRCAVSGRQPPRSTSSGISVIAPPVPHSQRSCLPGRQSTRNSNNRWQVPGDSRWRLMRVDHSPPPPSCLELTARDTLSTVGGRVARTGTVYAWANGSGCPARVVAGLDRSPIIMGSAISPTGDLRPLDTHVSGLGHPPAPALTRTRARKNRPRHRRHTDSVTGPAVVSPCCQHTPCDCGIGPSIFEYETCAAGRRSPKELSGRDWGTTSDVEATLAFRNRLPRSGPA